MKNHKIKGLRCVNSSIAQNIQEYNSRVRQRIYNVLKLGMIVKSSP